MSKYDVNNSIDEFVTDFLDSIIEIYDRLHMRTPYIFKYGNTFKLTELLMYCNGLCMIKLPYNYTADFVKCYKDELDYSLYIVNTFLIKQKKYYKTLELDYNLWYKFCYNMLLI